MNTPNAESVRLHVPKSAVELRTITDEEAGQRVDNFLMRHFKTVPRSRVYRLLRKGEVRVNRKRVDAEYRLAAGDEVRLPPVRIDAGSEPGQPSTSLLELIERSVIFQDKHVLVIDKPAGVAVHGGSGMSCARRGRARRSNWSIGWIATPAAVCSLHATGRPWSRCMR